VQTIPLEPVDSVHITILVDNVTDMLLLDQGPAKRVGVASGGQPPRVRAPLLEAGETLDALLAEHGFSALISVTKRGREHRVLFDAGVTPDGLVENMRRLELSPRDIETIALSNTNLTLPTKA
jgi:7,8-dihydropterin-6-yl-methyl-4-(beta-D-ribofuranosyl)aminobenzene 5'-phosphate synthase